MIDSDPPRNTVPHLTSHPYIGYYKIVMSTRRHSRSLIVPIPISSLNHDPKKIDKFLYMDMARVENSVLGTETT